MYIGSAKTYDFCMLVCFAFMYPLFSCLRAGILSSDIKGALVRTFEKRIPFQTSEKCLNVRLSLR